MHVQGCAMGLWTSCPLSDGFGLVVDLRIESHPLGSRDFVPTGFLLGVGVLGVVFAHARNLAGAVRKRVGSF